MKESRAGVAGIVFPIGTGAENNSDQYFVIVKTSEKK